MSMKNILMIGTGGTIASEMTPSGLTPELNSKQLLSFVPRIGELCHVDCIQLYSLDSTNIRPAHWGSSPVWARLSQISLAMPSYCCTSCCGSTSPRNWGAK